MPLLAGKQCGGASRGLPSRPSSIPTRVRAPARLASKPWHEWVRARATGDSSPPTIQGVRASEDTPKRELQPTKVLHGVEFWGGLRRGLVLGFLELQLAKFLDDILAMRTDIHLVVNVDNLSLLVDEECCPTGRRPGTLDKPIRLGHFPARITQNRIVKLQFFRESRIGFDVVATRGEVGDVEFAEDLAALTERLALGRSAPGECLGIPGNHDHSFVLEVGQFVGFAVAARKLEFRSRITRL